MAIDKLAQLQLLGLGKALGKQDHAAKGARLVDHGDLGPIEIIPDLHGDEAYQETENDAEAAASPARRP